MRRAIPAVFLPGVLDKYINAAIGSGIIGFISGCDFGAIGTEKVKGGVLIKYGAIVEEASKVRVRSDFLKTRSIIANATNTDATDDLRYIAELYTASGVSVALPQPPQDIRYIILDKLGYNFAGSIMGAIFGNTFGELASNQFTNKAIRDCAVEFYKLSKRLGKELAPSETAFADATVMALQANRDVISSPLQDVWAGRLTEKDQIIKATTELADEYHMQVPVLKAMYELISAVERKSFDDTSQVRTLQGQLLQKLTAERGDITRVARSLEIRHG